MSEPELQKLGCAYIYLSNEHGTIVEVYFGDLTLRHIKSPVLQHNEYYPFGLQTAIRTFDERSLKTTR